MNCKDIIWMTIETTQDLHRTKLRHSAAERLSRDCAIFDQMVSDFDCESFESDIDEKTLELIVSMKCPDVVLEYGCSHPFFSLLSDTKRFIFSADKDSVNVRFVFDGLWE